MSRYKIDSITPASGRVLFRERGSAPGDPYWEEPLIGWAVIWFRDDDDHPQQIDPVILANHCEPLPVRLAIEGTGLDLDFTILLPGEDIPMSWSGDCDGMGCGGEQCGSCQLAAALADEDEAVEWERACLGLEETL